MKRAVEADDERPAADPAEVAWRGVELCRRGEWNDGLYWLSLAAGATAQREQLPGLFFAYFGYAVARYQGRCEQGLALCRRAVELEFYQPESHTFLARTCLLAGDRRAAMDAVERGLQVDPTHRDLLALKRQMGLRRSPVVPFLSRRNPVNRLLGSVRHRLLGEQDGAAPHA